MLSITDFQVMLLSGDKARISDLETESKSLHASIASLEKDIADENHKNAQIAGLKALGFSDERIAVIMAMEN